MKGKENRISLVDTKLFHLILGNKLSLIYIIKT